MALHLPPAVSVSKFTGGYKATSDYTDLADTETNDSQNILYGPDGDLTTRLGSVRLRALRIANVATPTEGEPITGHFYFRKQSDSAFHVVAAGDSLYSYTSATAALSVLAAGLTDNSATFWTFTQIIDPRSATDDVMLATNGTDVIKMWNGSATATNLSSVTLSTGVPKAKHMITHKNRVYLANINDTSDVNAPQKVMVSEISTTGAPAPHRFTDFFYVGGTNQVGDIRNLAVLNDQIIIYTRKSVWKFNPGGGNILDTSTLVELQETHGLLAPFSLVNTGEFHIFLSERGVYAFDGISFTHLSEKVDDDILKNSTVSLLKFAKGVFHKEANQYILYYPAAGSNTNNRALAFDLRLKSWQPPITGRRVSYASTFDDGDGYERMIYGDYVGYLYQDRNGLNDGLTTGYNGTVSSATISTITEGSANFTTANDALAGVTVRIVSGLGEGQERYITTNTSNTITVDSVWSIVPDTTSHYSVGAIPKVWRSKDFDFAGHDITKLFRYIRLRTREEGNFTLTVHYIVDFNDLGQATSKDVSLLDEGMAWGLSRWGQARWGGKDTIDRRIDMRNTSAQSVIGNHLAIRFSNFMANQSFKISGFDIDLKPVGKR